ncbi:MAG: halocarboxylic acid dehydrogenase DehI family protein [Acidobacteria bacterium]|nr:halocarboxylic acid dehydrogenase DehI family protein [Acidobacteriota bacterium]
MLGLGKPKHVTERDAEGETERVYHEIKQTLRVSGVNLNFRTWASYEKFLPLMWDAMRPVVETRAFEDAADELRAQAVVAAEGLGALDVADRVRLGESQKYQIQAALDLYHYINPKLLVFTSAVKLALERSQTNSAQREEREVELIERGIPAGVYPMEMISAEPEDERLAKLFEDIKQTLSLSSINSDYRTLGLWPDYLTASWQQLKPITQQKEYQKASDELRALGVNLAASFVTSIPLSREAVEEAGENSAEILQTTENFERLLPSLIINVSLLSLDWKTPEQLRKSPFPAAARVNVRAARGAS